MPAPLEPARTHPAHTRHPGPVDPVIALPRNASTKPMTVGYIAPAPTTLLSRLSLRLLRLTTTRQVVYITVLDASITVSSALALPLPAALILNVRRPADTSAAHSPILTSAFYRGVALGSVFALIIAALAIAFLWVASRLRLPQLTLSDQPRMPVVLFGGMVVSVAAGWVASAMGMLLEYEALRAAGMDLELQSDLLRVEAVVVFAHSQKRPTSFPSSHLASTVMGTVSPAITTRALRMENGNGEDVVMPEDVALVVQGRSTPSPSPVPTASSHVRTHPSHTLSLLSSIAVHIVSAILFAIIYGGIALFGLGLFLLQKREPYHRVTGRIATPPVAIGGILVGSFCAIASPCSSPA
ncbi:hypothetical protein C8Q76DRAFT_800342 [Earliella scabrosa]|nr:hypothetical protein C8Q76DRAFT_800342 [Earliella scabrosa]